MSRPAALAADPEFRALVDAGVPLRELSRRFSCSKTSAAAARRIVEGAPKPATAAAIEIRPDGDCLAVDARGQGLVKSLEDLIREAEIDLRRWRIAAHKIKTWTSTIKGPDDLPRIVRNWGVSATLEPKIGESVRCTVARTHRPMPRAATPPRESGPVALIISDPQVGFRRRKADGALEPMHDRRALDVLLQVAAIVQPDVIVCLGDALDLAEWSTRYPRPVEIRDTTAPTLAEWHWWLAQFRATCPAAEMVWLEGNHEARIRKSLEETMPVAATLATVDDPDTPRVALADLCHLDRIGVDYVGPYPSSWWLWDTVEIIHGETVRAKSGATVAAEIGELHHSRIMGHVHRLEVAHRTLWGPRGARTIFAASLGCTCRIGEGAVPGTKPRNNWAQAWGLVTLRGRTAHLESGLIDRGAAVVRGREYVAEDPTARIESDIGYRMVRDWLQEGE